MKYDSAKNNIIRKESDSIKVRYEKRNGSDFSHFYGFGNPCVYMSQQELERKILRKILLKYFDSLSEATFLEVGCGSGINLLNMLKYGFSPQNLYGIDLLPERIDSAKKKLPPSINLSSGDAITATYDRDKFSIILQSTVFTSILDYDVKLELARRMWDLLEPGGGVIWYDFMYNNPRNPDVQGIGRKEIRSLFPDSSIVFEKLTLAPPICRRVSAINPVLYTLFNSIPFLRTHLLCWISKPE